MTLPVCIWCGEPVHPEEQARDFSNPIHYECGVRSIVGSVGHIHGRCSCFEKDPAKQEDDPPGLTTREAARVATVLFYRLRDRGAAWSPDKCSPNPMRFIRAKS